MKKALASKDRNINVKMRIKNRQSISLGDFACLFQFKTSTGALIDYNSKTQNLLNLPEKVFLNKMSFSDFFHNKNEYKDFINILTFKGEVNNFKTKFRLHDSTILTCLLSGIIYPDLNYIEGSIFDISDYRHKNEVAKLLEEKEIIVKETHHRVKNNLESVRIFLSMQSDSVVNSEAILILENAIGRVESIQLLYEMLLYSKQFQKLSTKQYLDYLIDEITKHFSKKINVVKQIMDLDLDEKKLIPLALIINELLTNSMKYGFIGRESGIIKITLKNNQNILTLIVQDDGVGFPNNFNFNSAKSLGIDLVKIMINQIGGKLEINNQAGLKMSIDFEE
jgi:two-component sensor histidine kinase